jgi:hypothetical protein
LDKISLSPPPHHERRWQPLIALYKINLLTAQIASSSSSEPQAQTLLSVKREREKGKRKSESNNNDKIYSYIKTSKQ